MESMVSSVGIKRPLSGKHRSCCAFLLPKPALVYARRWWSRRFCKISETGGEENAAEDASEKVLWLIVGLGNIGPRYEDTRHNVGFMVVDEIAQQEGIIMNKHKHKATVGQGRIEGVPVLLMKPTTFMNNSGEAVREASQYHQIPKERVLVTYDDLDLAPGTVRLRGKGGHGGHRGMQSISTCLNGKEFPRLRVGIGRPSGSQPFAPYVLEPFDQEEREVIENAIQECTVKIRAVLGLGLEKALSGMTLKKGKSS